jgi:hypothetical protein
MTPLRIMPVLTVLAFGVGAGCGDDDGKTATAPATTTTADASPPEAFSDFQPLETGRTYTTKVFKPAVRFTVPAGSWASDTGDRPAAFAVAAVDPDEPVDQAIIGVHRFTNVFDAKRGGRKPGDTVPLRGSFATWLRTHPHLRTTAPRRAELLGLTGTQIDVTTRSSPPRVPDDCGKVGDRCVPLFDDGLDHVMYGEETKGRFIVLELPDGGEVVIEESGRPKRSFERILRILRPVLAELELVQP